MVMNTCRTAARALDQNCTMATAAQLQVGSGWHEAQEQHMIGMLCLSSLWDPILHDILLPLLQH
jgi:hypothetical protein